MSEFLSLFALFLPLVAILAVANAAQRARERNEPSGAFTAFAYILTAGLYLLLLIGGLLLLLAASVLQSQPAPEALGGAGLDFATLANPALLAWGLVLPALAGILLLLPPLRRAVARVTPLDAANPVHAVALSLSMVIIINLTLTLGVGLGNLTDMLVEAQEETGRATTSLVGIWTQDVLMVLLAFVGVGWPIRRSFGQSLERLGLVVPTLGQVALGIGLAFVMVGVVLLIQAVAATLGFGLDADVEELTEQLLGPLFQTPAGILTLGLAAALGEEPLMRGAAQPRFGILLTALLFALLHSNYGITLSTAVVFLLGLVLGWVRIRHNTTTAMILHAVYNIILGVMAYLSIDLLEQMTR